jgi:hypothetical protein
MKHAPNGLIASRFQLTNFFFVFSFGSQYCTLWLETIGHQVKVTVSYAFVFRVKCFYLLLTCNVVLLIFTYLSFLKQGYLA